MTIFCGLWAFICFLSSLQLYGMYDFSERPYFIIFIGTIGYCIGYVLRLAEKRRFCFTFNKKKISTQADYEYRFNEKLLFMCSLAVTIFYLILVTRVLAIVASGQSYAAIRTLYLHGSDDGQVNIIYGSSILDLMDTFIIRPMIFAFIPVNVVYFLKRMKLNKITILFLINITFYSLITFGRIAIVHIMIDLVFCTLIMKKRLDLQTRKIVMRKFKRYIVPILAIMVIIIYNISTIRQSEKSDPISVSEQFYSYMTVSLPLLDNWLTYIDNNDFLTCGIMFFKGILNFLMVFLRKIGLNFTLFQDASTILTNTEQFIPVFPGRVYNAFVSIFYAFYVDFREVGVVIGSAIYGWVMCSSFKSAQSGNVLSLSIYLLLMQSLVKCFVRWEFVQMSYCIAFVWIFIWIRKQTAYMEINEKNG